MKIRFSCVIVMLAFILLSAPTTHASDFGIEGAFSPFLTTVDHDKGMFGGHLAALLKTEYGSHSILFKLLSIGGYERPQYAQRVVLQTGFLFSIYEPIYAGAYFGLALDPEAVGNESAPKPFGALAFRFQHHSGDGLFFYMEPQFGLGQINFADLKLGAAYYF